MRTSSLAALLAAATAFAHPMGNFSINHYTKLTITPKSIEVRYVIDMAEIPTFQEMREFKVGPASDAPAISQFVAQKEIALKSAVALESDGRPVPLDPVSRKLDFTDGAGGQPSPGWRLPRR